MKHLNSTKFKLFTLLGLTSFALVGCSEEYLQKYGYGNAYNTTSSGAYFHAPSTVEYYIDPSVTGNHLTAVKAAIVKANQLTKAVTITTTDNSDSKFVIKRELISITASGRNSMSANSLTGEVVSSTITLNSFYSWCYTVNNWTHVALHEIGHTFGLVDLSIKGAKYTIMADYSLVYTFTDYQEFDKDNISWLYD